MLPCIQLRTVISMHASSLYRQVDYTVFQYIMSNVDTTETYQVNSDITMNFQPHHNAFAPPFSRPHPISTDTVAILSPAFSLHCHCIMQTVLLSLLVLSYHVSTDTYRSHRLLSTASNKYPEHSHWQNDILVPVFSVTTHTDPTNLNPILQYYHDILQVISSQTIILLVQKTVSLTNHFLLLATTTKWRHKKPKQQLMKTTNICRTKPNETQGWFRSTFMPPGHETDCAYSTAPQVHMEPDT